MKILFYIVLISTLLTILIMLINRIYFEINLAIANKKLNEELKKVTNEQVKVFSKELREILYEIIDTLTENYNELLNSDMSDFEEKR